MGGLDWVGLCIREITGVLPASSSLWIRTSPEARDIPIPVLRTSADRKVHAISSRFARKRVCCYLVGDGGGGGGGGGVGDFVRTMMTMMDDGGLNVVEAECLVRDCYKSGLPGRRILSGRPQRVSVFRVQNMMRLLGGGGGRRRRGCEASCSGEGAS